MNSIVISSVITALLVLSGCSNKEPVVEAEQEAAIEKTCDQEPLVETETVSSDEASVMSEDRDYSSSSSSAMSIIEDSIETIYFDFDKFHIRSDMQDRVTNDASIANGSASRFSLKLEGNCDEWGSDEYNFALGLKRANTVKKSLLAEGVEANRITMVSYGESNPVCTNKTQDCWGKNRRVDFKLLP